SPAALLPRGRLTETSARALRPLPCPLGNRVNHGQGHIEIQAPFLGLEPQTNYPVPHPGSARKRIVVPVLHGRDDARQESPEAARGPSLLIEAVPGIGNALPVLMWQEDETV